MKDFYQGRDVNKGEHDKSEVKRRRSLGGKVERDELELRALEEELRELLLQMELHHEKDSPEEFEDWWYTQGNEARYFERKRQIEIKEESIRKMKWLSEGGFLTE